MDFFAKGKKMYRQPHEKTIERLKKEGYDRIVWKNGETFALNKRFVVNEPIKKYHSDPAVCRSDLMRIAESPEKYHFLQSHPEEATDALLLGSAVHKLVLEPEDFDKEFAVEPIVNKSTRIGKETIEAFRAENAGKTIISAKLFQQAQEMKNAVYANKKAKFLLSGSIEKSYYWEDELTGQAVKCRPDVVKKMGKRGLIVDLKTGTDVSTVTFCREAVKYGYDVQAAMCKIGVEKALGYEHDVVYVAVEKTPPYAVNIMQADPLVLEYGQRRFRELLGTYVECKESDKWYGYLGFSDEINVFTLPAYLLKELQ